MVKSFFFHFVGDSNAFFGLWWNRLSHESAAGRPASWAVACDSVLPRRLQDLGSHCFQTDVAPLASQLITLCSQIEPMNPVVPQITLTGDHGKVCICALPSELLYLHFSCLHFRSRCPSTRT